MKKFLAVLFFTPIMAHADFWHGNDLYNRLNSSDAMERVQGMGYVMGIYDVGVNALFCPRTEQGITAGQIKDMVFNWLTYNPGRRNEPAERLVLDMFKQTWPCSNRNNGRPA